MTFDELDVLCDLPFEAAVRVAEGGAWLHAEVSKVIQNPVSCKTNHLSAPGFFYSHKEGQVVSRKNRTGTANGNGATPSESGRDVIRWVNARIPDELIGDVEGLCADSAALCVKFMAYTADGADILLKRKRGTADWLAMLTLDDPYITGGRCALTGWGNNPVDAVAALVAKWEFVLGGALPEPTVQGSVPDRRFG